jgi:hypothetical protein
LMGSALARVRWELDLNRRWERDPTFYLDQTLTALLESLVEPPPFDATRTREIVTRMQDMPKILSDGEANLHAVRPFAQLAIDSLQQIRPELLEVEREVAPMLKRGALQSGDVSGEFHAATEKTIVALEGYRAWLQERLQKMPENAAVGRANYEFFLSHVALVPYTPEQLLAISRQEWERAVTFEQLEKQRNQGLPELKIAASIEEQIRTSDRDEQAIRDYLEKKGILTVSPEIGHYTIRLMPGYLNALSGFGETDDFLHSTECAGRTSRRPRWDISGWPRRKIRARIWCTRACRGIISRWRGRGRTTIRFAATTMIPDRTKGWGFTSRR